MKLGVRGTRKKIDANNCFLLLLPYNVSCFGSQVVNGPSRLDLSSSATKPPRELTADIRDRV